MSAVRRLYVTSYTEGFSHFVTSMTAPVASGWSVRRVGLSPTGKRRISRRTLNSGRSPTTWQVGQTGPKWPVGVLLDLPLDLDDYRRPEHGIGIMDVGAWLRSLGLAQYEARYFARMTSTPRCCAT